MLAPIPLPKVVEFRVPVLQIRQIAYKPLQDVHALQLNLDNNYAVSQRERIDFTDLPIRKQIKIGKSITILV